MLATREGYMVKIRKHRDGWYFRCPEHHDDDNGMGPFRTWEMCYVIASLHISNFNHF